MRQVITPEELEEKIAKGEMDYLAGHSKNPELAISEIRSLVESHHASLPRPDHKKLRVLQDVLGEILSDDATLQKLSSSIDTAHFFGTSPELYDPEKDLPVVLRQLEEACGEKRGERRGAATAGTEDIEFILIARIWANYIDAPFKVTDNPDNPFIKTLRLMFPGISAGAAKDILKKTFPAGRRKRGK